MNDDRNDTLAEDKLRLRARAYKQLLAGAEALLEQDTVYWTERILLKLVKGVYSHRIDQVTEHISIEGTKEDSLAKQKEALLDAAAEAALGGHDLGQWEPVDNGYQASCKLCKATTWIGDDGMRYSLFEDTCAGIRI